MSGLMAQTVPRRIGRCGIRLIGNAKVSSSSMSSSARLDSQPPFVARLKYDGTVATEQEATSLKPFLKYDGTGSDGTSPLSFAVDLFTLALPILSWVDRGDKYEG